MSKLVQNIRIQIHVKGLGTIYKQIVIGKKLFFIRKKILLKIFSVQFKPRAVAKHDFVEKRKQRDHLTKLEPKLNYFSE